MNERIKQLIEQATIRGEEYRPGDDGHPTPTFYFDKEKFAELIVQRTLDIVDAHTEIFQTDRDKAVIEHIKQSINKDFNIK